MAPVRFDPERNLRPHALDAQQLENVKKIEEMSVSFAQSIMELCPGNGETVLALRHLEDCKMRCTQSIACGPQ